VIASDRAALTNGETENLVARARCGVGEVLLGGRASATGAPTRLVSDRAYFEPPPPSGGVAEGAWEAAGVARDDIGHAQKVALVVFAYCAPA
jgi:hypothetical protein